MTTPTPPEAPDAPDVSAAPAASEPIGTASEPVGTGDRASHVHREGALAFRNAIKLTLSLIATWSVALVVTFKLPVYLDKALYGDYQNALALATTAFVFVELGVDTYIQREVPVRPKHASQFFLGLGLARLAVSLPLFLACAFEANRRGWATNVVAATMVFAVSQFFTAFNTTFQKTLQAATKVDALAVVNVACKLLFGIGTFVVIALRVPFVLLLMPMLVSEIIKAIFLFRATRKAVDLELNLDLKETYAVMKESLPFFVNSVAVTLGTSLDVLVLGVLVDDPLHKEIARQEVGVYAAAKQIAGLSALLSPIMGGVMIPLMRRAHARSEDEFFAILRRVIEGVVVVALPLTLILALSADVALHYALRDKYTEAAGSLQALAPTFVFAYGNVLLWLALMIMGRSWQITIVSILGLGLLVVLTLVIVPLTRPLGLGGAGMGAGIALSTRELIIIITFLILIGKRALDGRNIGAVVKSLLIGAIVTASHIALGRVLHGWPQLVLRVALDCALYGALLLGLRVVRVGDAKSVLKLIKNRRNA